jgi:polysaccharide export outer membrane protein
MKPERDRRSRWKSLSAVGLLLATFASHPTHAQTPYRLQVGDTLEVSVVGLPELKQRPTIGPDGSVNIPLAGRIQATGRSLPEVETAIRDALASKVVQSRTADGRPSSIVIEANQVGVTIAEYKPIYVSGSVATPGEHRYRPGMTARQALALAGGTGIPGAQRGSLVLEIPQLEAELAAVAAELARDRARAARLQAELEGRTKLQLDEKPAPLLPPEFLASVARLETDQLKARQANEANELQHLDRVRAQVQSELNTLRQQQQQQKEAVQQQTAELAQIRTSFARGAAAATRVSEEQRALNLANERLLETTARIAQSERALEDLARQRQRTVDERRLGTLQELQETRLRIAAAEARRQGTSERLALATSSRVAGL